MALHDHRGDPFAHAPMAERFMRENTEHLVEVEARQTAITVRLTDIEKFQQRLVGGMLVIGAMIGGGILDFLVRVHFP